MDQAVSHGRYEMLSAEPPHRSVLSLTVAGRRDDRDAALAFLQRTDIPHETIDDYREAHVIEPLNLDARFASFHRSTIACRAISQRPTMREIR